MPLPPPHRASSHSNSGSPASISRTTPNFFRAGGVLLGGLLSNRAAFKLFPRIYNLKFSFFSLASLNLLFFLFSFLKHFSSYFPFAFRILAFFAFQIEAFFSNYYFLVVLLFACFQSSFSTTWARDLSLSLQFSCPSSSFLSGAFWPFYSGF